MFNRGKQKPPTQPLSPMQDSVTVMQGILRGMGVDPDQALMPTSDGFGWNFRRGSAIVEIYLTQQNGIGLLKVLSPIIHLPPSGLLPLYRRLLELNLTTSNAAFGVHADVVYVFSERPLAGLDPEEVDHIVEQVANLADEYDDRLVSEFGGRLYVRV
jgi:hypothetical protein